MRIFMKFRQNIPGIMTNESVSGNLDIQHIFPVASIYATRLPYFLATPTLDADIYTTDQNIEKARHTFVD